MEEGKSNNSLQTVGTTGGASGNNLNRDKNSIMIVGSGLVEIPPTANINTISGSSGNVNNQIKDRDSTGGNRQGNSDSNIHVNNILAEADSAAIAAQTIALPPTTLTGTANVLDAGSAVNILNSNADTNSIQNAMTGTAAANIISTNACLVNSNANTNQGTVSNGVLNNTANAGSTNYATMNNMNLNQYILASAGLPPTSLPITTTAVAPGISLNNVTSSITPGTSDANNSYSSGNANVINNNNQHFQFLQQNAAIMQQNAATLQNLQQANKLLTANPEAAAATLGMLAPIMNMNLTTTNPVQLLTTATPPLNLSNTGAVANTATSTLLPAATVLQTPTANLPKVGGTSSTATAPSISQQQQPCHTQQKSLPVAAQPESIAIATDLSQTPAQGAAISSNMNVNNGNITNNNSGVVDGTDNNNNEAVQQFLRTFMLQNSGLPLLQQGVVPQQQQFIQTGNLMLVPNNINANNPFGVAPADVTATNNLVSGVNDTGGKHDESVTNKIGNSISESTSISSGPTSAAAAAANAAASVLPSASMNLPLQQQLQQQQQQQLNASLTPQMGIDLSGNNNAITILGGTALNNVNNGNTITNNPLQMAGLATLQQQQQHIQTMAYSPMILSQPHSQLSLTQQQQQKPSLGIVLNPSAIATTAAATATTSNSTPILQQQPQVHKKQPSISRPLYLDHDSNCLTAYQCFLRKQIELFEVGHDEMTGTAQGRNTPLQFGQVGIRCRHCAHLPKAARARGGVYYSRTIDGVYQVAQNMSKLHFLKACTLIPEVTRNQLKSLQSVSSRASGGKEYWAEGLRVLGIVEEGGMLRFASNTSSTSSSSTPSMTTSAPTSKSTS